jgi:hypothetical protein
MIDEVKEKTIHLSRLIVFGNKLLRRNLQLERVRE